MEYTTAGWEMFSPQAYLIFNMRKPPFDNLKVRQAVMAAINRNMVVNNIFFGLGKVATSPFVTTEMFYDKNMPAMPFDMKQARALIKESGIKPGDYTIRQLSFPTAPPGTAWPNTPSRRWSSWASRSTWSPPTPAAGPAAPATGTSI